MTIALQDFGPPVGDADGIDFGDGFIFVGDRDEGVRRIALSGDADTVFIPGAAINRTGSPVIYRPSDGHVFVGYGFSGGNRIDEYNTAGGFVQAHTTVAEVETMTFDSATGLIYYATFGMEVRSYHPIAKTDLHVGNSSGFIDGGLAFDPISQKLFVGTANGLNSGLVEILDPITGVTQPFASGFNGSLGGAARTGLRRSLFSRIQSAIPPRVGVCAGSAFAHTSYLGHTSFDSPPASHE